ncbi:MAG: hypothetical protein CEN90_162 [Parcubacteria group bacterium Licking1014_17]|nr:MAG: hypothetical protein CEN90_162 [Parcubacteria group bacterium Licking1014_17]
MSKHALDILFGSGLRFKLLKFFFRNPDVYFSDLDAANHTQEDINLVRKELKVMKEIRLLRIAKRSKVILSQNAEKKKKENTKE